MFDNLCALGAEGIIFICLGRANMKDILMKFACMKNMNAEGQ